MVYTQADVLTEQTALYRSNKQQSAQASSFVGTKSSRTLHAALLVFSLLGVKILAPLDEDGAIGLQGCFDARLCLSAGLCVPRCCLLCLLLLHLQDKQRSSGQDKADGDALQGNMTLHHHLLLLTLTASALASE